MSPPSREWCTDAAFVPRVSPHPFLVAGAGGSTFHVSLFNGICMGGTVATNPTTRMCKSVYCVVWIQKIFCYGYAGCFRRKAGRRQVREADSPHSWPSRLCLATAAA